MVRSEGYGFESRAVQKFSFKTSVKVYFILPLFVPSFHLRDAILVQTYVVLAAIFVSYLEPVKVQWVAPNSKKRSVFLLHSLLALFLVLYLQRLNLTLEKQAINGCSNPFVFEASFQTITIATSSSQSFIFSDTKKISGNPRFPLQPVGEEFDLNQLRLRSTCFAPGRQQFCPHGNV